jgi:hypothetical protein
MLDEYGNVSKTAVVRTWNRLYWGDVHTHSKAGRSKNGRELRMEHLNQSVELLSPEDGQTLYKESYKFSLLMPFLVKSQNCPHKHASTICTIFLFTPLLWMVAHSIFAGYEDHCCRASTTGKDAVVASAASHSPNQVLLVCGISE